MVANMPADDGVDDSSGTFPGGGGDDGGGSGSGDGGWTDGPPPQDGGGNYETRVVTKKDYTQREGMKERGQNEGLDPTDVGRDPYDSKADAEVTQWRRVGSGGGGDDGGGGGDDRNKPPRDRANDPNLDNDIIHGGDLGQDPETTRGTGEDAIHGGVVDELNSARSSILGTNQSKDYTGSQSGGGYSTLISPSSNTGTYEAPSYDFQLTDSAKRSSKMGGK